MKNNSFKDTNNIIKFTDNKGRLSWPTQGKIIVNFGTKVNQSELTWSGILIQATQGKPVTAIANGKVVFAKWLSGYGLLVIINHGNGYMTRYAHAEKLLVDVGDIVMKGQNVALVGSTGRSTGPHVHFEVYKNGRVVDPAAYIHRTAR